MFAPTTKDETEEPKLLNLILNSTTLAQHIAQLIESLNATGESIHAGGSTLLSMRSPGQQSKAKRRDILGRIIGQYRPGEELLSVTFQGANVLYGTGLVTDISSNCFRVDGLFIEQPDIWNPRYECNVFAAYFVLYFNL